MLGAFRMEWPILVLIGLIAGTFGSIVGLGGGVIIVPSLLYVSSIGLLDQIIEPSNAAGISLMVIIFNALSATIYNYKEKRVDMKSGLFFFLASGPGTILGSILNKYVSINQFYILFGLIMILMTFLLTQQNKTKPIKIKWDVIKEYIDKDGTKHTYGYNRIVGFILAFCVGILGGLFGIGGGAILVPMMIILFQFPVHVATATSMFIILLSSSVGSIPYIIQGDTIFTYVLVIGFGAFIGGRFGSYISTKMSSKVLTQTLRIVIILVALRMIYNGIVA